MSPIRSQLVGAVVAAAVAIQSTSAQGSVQREAMVGAHALVSHNSLPLLSGGLGGSVDIVSRNPHTLRVSTVITTPIVYGGPKVCLASPGGACSDGKTAGSQLVTFVADATARFRHGDTQRAFISLGGYMLDPSHHYPHGGYYSEREYNFVMGVGYENLFGGTTPKYALTVRYLRYNWVYQQISWAGTIGVSRVFRFD
jgi:hypothetical protein